MLNFISYSPAKREKLQYERGFEEGFKYGYEKARKYWKPKAYNRGMRRGILNTALFATPLIIFLALRGD